MQEWTDSFKVAERIFDFFGAECSRREHGGVTLFEGKVWGKLLVLTCGSANEQFGVQLRTLKTYKSQCGALLFSCSGIEFDDSDKNSGKTVVIYSHNGNVVVNKWGIYSNISTSQVMTPQEVYERIASQTQWSDEEKLGVRSLYISYVSNLDTPNPYLAERVVEWRKQLLELGIKV